MANEAYIIGAVRTPTGRKKGSLAGVHAADLGAHAIRSLIERTGVDPGEIDDVVFGCVDQVGPLAGDIARTCWLAAGLPENVPGTTVDRQCGSSQQAVHFAAQAVMSGSSDLVIAGGVQNMSMIPIGASMIVAQQFGFDHPWAGCKGWDARYGKQPVSQFKSAVLIASERAVKAHNLKPRARVHHMSVRGDDPIWMLTAPIPATKYALAKAGMKLEDIDLVEINEAFASVVMAWAKETGADMSK